MCLECAGQPEPCNACRLQAINFRSTWLEPNPFSLASGTGLTMKAEPGRYNFVLGSTGTFLSTGAEGCGTFTLVSTST